MRTIGVVCRKEVLETARDRRTLMSLLIGPLLGPAIFAISINMVVSQAVTSMEQTLQIAILGAERAPNLIAFLKARGIEPLEEQDLEDVEAAALAVKSGAHSLVLAIDEQFAEAFGTERAARVTLVIDRSNSRAASRVERVRSAVNAYGQQIGALRLLAIGVNPTLLRPVMADELDVSTPAGRSVVMLGMLTYFLLFATLTGGLHLAIDTTAGERERKSLEPLLTTAVTRAELLFGKMAATVAYMLSSLALTLIAFTIALRFLPLEALGMSTAFDAATSAVVWLVVAPFAPLGAALMTLVASFTKTYREAQTYLTFVLLVPTLPLIFATILNVEAEAALMLIPSLSQHLLVKTLIEQEPLQLTYVVLSAGSTLLLGALLAGIAVRLYQREGLLG